MTQLDVLNELSTELVHGKERDNESDNYSGKPPD